MDDDDEPPPLSSLTEQVEALRLRSEGAATAVAADDALRVASTVVVASSSDTGKSKPAALKKGFFDAKPSGSKPKPKPKPKDDVEEIPVIRAKKGGVAGGPQIPDFLRVEPDDQALKYQAMKAELVEKLKPTPDMVGQIAQDADLLQGFDDPEVMAAVNDVAQNPQNFHKYKNNPKVVKFYSNMGKLMGEKLDKMEQGKQPQPGPAR